MKYVLCWVAYVLSITMFELFLAADPFNADQRPPILMAGLVGIVGGVALGAIQATKQPRGAAISLLGAAIGMAVYGSSAMLLGASGQVNFLGFPLAALILIYRVARPRSDGPNS